MFHSHKFCACVLNVWYVLTKNAIHVGQYTHRLAPVYVWSMSICSNSIEFMLLQDGCAGTCQNHSTGWWFGTFLITFFSIYWEWSSQLTKSIIFSGWLVETTNQKYTQDLGFHGHHDQLVSFRQGDKVPGQVGRFKIRWLGSQSYRSLSG